MSSQNQLYNRTTRVTDDNNRIFECEHGVDLFSNLEEQGCILVETSVQENLPATEDYDWLPPFFIY